VIFRTIGRLFIIAFGLLFAAAASCFVIVTLGLERITGALHVTTRGGNDAIETALELMNQGIVLTTGMTIIPALLVILIGELASIRSATYYIAAGGAALVAIPLLAQVGQTGTFVLPEQMVWLVFATAGFAGGFVYWLLAGRTA
jgi:hypothetical protein